MASMRASNKNTRIPKFGSSRIPLPGSTVPQPRPPNARGQSVVAENISPDPDNAISIADLGKRVRIAGTSEGWLRFVGEVQFAAGVWAGIELYENNGKHDGYVQGIRYFTCPPAYGLMTPLSKVSLIDTPDTDSSGPYSMIFGIDDDVDPNATIKYAAITETPKCGQPTHKMIRSLTFDKIDTSPEQNKDYFTDANTTIIHAEPSDFLMKQFNNTVVVSEPILKSAEFAEMQPMDTTTILNSTKIVVKDLNTTVTLMQNQNVEATFVKELANSGSQTQASGDYALGGETFVQSKTDTNKTFDAGDVAYKQSRIGKANLTIKRKTFVLDLPSNYPDLKLVASSTPQGEEIVHRRYRPSPSHLDDESNKRDSLECEESLGILTPDQMIDCTCLAASRTPSSENIRLLPHDNESSAVGEYSLGILDLSNVTMNLLLTNGTRMEQTPSPEELPLDPTPLQDPKEKKPPNSIITSITSITSLDTGYQGDGEMSRPASRGADNSPMTRRPQPRQPPRRADPMTDSDFYTESDADNHDDNPLRGDRKAQVIDGTLYGVDAQATADLYANNRENMDSSGIFTDIERTEDISTTDNDVNDTQDASEANQMQMELSPSDSSTQTISDDSQNNVNMILDKTMSPPLNKSAPSAQMDPEVVSNASTITSAATSIRSTRAARIDDSKHKMPKRNVPSKVKAMIEPNNKENAKRIVPKKAGPGRWDAVMNKISSPDTRKGTKEVKSKVFNNLNTNLHHFNEKKVDQPKTTINNRRIRSRIVASPKQTGSISSSLSDLSGASRTTKSPGSAKKREALKGNQILNGTKLLSNTGPNEARNNSKNLLSSKESKEKKKENVKDTGRTTVKGALVTTASNRPQLQQRAAITKQLPAPRTAEALAVMVQHLVFNLEAFKNPGLRKEAAKAKLEAEEARMACGLLEESLGLEKQRHSEIVQEERSKYRAEITHLIEKQRNDIIEINTKHQQEVHRLEIESNRMKNTMVAEHDVQMRNVKMEFQKLQTTHSELLDILREENDAIREEIDEKNDKIKCLERFKHESEKLRLDYEAKEVKLQEAYEEIHRLREEKDAWFAQRNSGDTYFNEVQSLRAVLDLKQSEFAELRKSLAEVSHKADQLPAAEEKIVLLTAKCEDLQHQLERKSDSEMMLYTENKKLNESIKEEINQRQRLRQHNEELQWRLQQNKEVFDHIKHGSDQSFTRSMISSSFNERHSASKHSSFERTLSFRERKISTMSNTSRKSRSSLDADLDDISPPSSPKVKGVVEKSDSVSYVLEMDESPETVASRIVRRSFRNATPPKNTPTKSPANKRPRKNNLMQSTSATSIPSTKDVCAIRPASARTDLTEEFEWGPVIASSPFNARRFDDKPYCIGDYEEEDLIDLRLPELPSEIGRKHGNTLPIPKHMAGEAMISESNSEDESSSSSSSGPL